jgi:GR25 family glycosyltransferase involved in LPS biosynthesis
MTAAEASCTWKHWQALTRIVEERSELSVVMEDNVAFSGSISDALRVYQAERESNAWDMVFDSDLWGLLPEAP